MNRFLPVVSACAALAFAFSASAEDNKAAKFCTDAHMKEMDSKVSGMSDAKMKQSASEHLEMSKAAFKKNDKDGCVQHMEEAHKAMGM